jgi:dCMP deaminase
MLIALLGPPQSGKTTFATYLQQHHNYTIVHILPSSSKEKENQKNELYFSTSNDFLDYATRNWRCDFVTRDLRSRNKLMEFMKRPFVVVVSIESPLMVRWGRSQSK